MPGKVPKFDMKWSRVTRMKLMKRLTLKELSTSILRS
jgi:hypothetical protein